jgi:hypothetical protein
MSESSDLERRDVDDEADEEVLFKAALAAFAAGNLPVARHWFAAVVELAGRREQEARRYLEEVDLREGPADVMMSYGYEADEEGGTAEVGDAEGESAPEASESVEEQDWSDEGGGTGAPWRGRGDDESYGAGGIDSALPLPLEALAGRREALPSSQPAGTLRRTPHLTLTSDGPSAPGELLAVSVWADTGPFLAGEWGAEVVVEDAPDEIELEVWLVASEHFTIEGPDVQPLVLRRAEARSSTARFAVKVRLPPASAASAGAFLSALFAYRGRPCGRVTRPIDLALPRPAAVPAAGSRARQQAALSVETAAEPADLIVRIVAGSLSDGRVFECRVQTRLLSAYAAGASETWRLADVAPEVVASYMKFVTAKGIADQVRTFALRGAGINLFEASPKLFQRVFWALVDARKLPRTIAVISEEPTFPWELMVPSRTVAGDDQQRDPLGVEFLVSRWTARDQVHPVQHLTLEDCYVVAPTDSRLSQAAAEARMVIGRFEPGKASSIDPAGVVNLDTTLGGAGRSLLHFVCHGKSGGAAGQTLLLQNKEELNSSFVRAMPGLKKGFRAAKPLVFLNACEVGRAEPALVGVGGFAEAFMTLGASAVIAPLWSVKDSIAHDIAVEFYERSRREPKTPFAEILRDLRKRSYGPGGGEDSWAAYCFYGDPLATGA